MTQKVQPTPTAATRPTVRSATPAAKPSVLPSVSWPPCDLQKSYCWWKKSCTSCWISHYLQGFYTCRISSINSMTERKQFQNCWSQIRDVKLENKSGVKNIRINLPVKHILFVVIWILDMTKLDQRRLKSCPSYWRKQLCESLLRWSKCRLLGLRHRKRYC